MKEQVRPTEQQSRWLDNSLDQAAEAPNARIRANTVVALAALGGPRRMEQLARLTGRACLDVKRGDRGAAEVVAVALRETKRDDFTETDREALRAVLDDGGVSLNRRERAAANAVLLRSNPIAEWWGVRRFTPRPNVARLLVLSFQASALAALAIWIVLSGLADFALGSGMIPTEAVRTLGSALPLGMLATVCAIAGAWMVNPGLVRRTAVALDAIVVGLLAATLGSVLLALLFAGGYFTTTIIGTGFVRANQSGVLPLVFLCFVAPGLFTVRLILGILPPGLTRIESVVPAVGLPILVGTLVALALTRWGPSQGIEAISIGWAAFIVCIVAFAVAVAQIDADWPVMLRQARGDESHSQGLWGGAAVFATLALLAGFAFSARLNTGLNVADVLQVPDQDETRQRHIALGAPVLLKGPSGASVKVGVALPRDFPDVVLVIRSGIDELASEPNFRGLRISMPRVASVTLRDRPLEVCLIAIADYAPQRGCGVGNVDPGSWLPILTGKFWVDKKRRASSPPAWSPSLVVLRYTPPRVAQLSIPPDTFAAWSEGKKEAFTKEIPGTSESGVWQFDTPIKLHLSAGFVADDTTRDRLLVLQKDGDLYALAGSPPELKIDLTPGTYQICGRLFDAIFRGCDGPSYELLFEPIKISLSPSGRQG